MLRRIGAFALARIIGDALNEQFDARKADPVVKSITHDDMEDRAEFTVSLSSVSKFRIRIDTIE